LGQLTPEERDRYEVLEEMNHLRRYRTMTGKISYSQELDTELLDKMQRFDPEFRLFAIFEASPKSFHTKPLCAFDDCVHFVAHTPSAESA